MEIPENHPPRWTSAADTWEDWMDTVELKWQQTMEAARLEYEGVREAVQARPPDQKERLHSGMRRGTRPMVDDSGSMS